MTDKTAGRILDGLPQDLLSTFSVRSKETIELPQELRNSGASWALRLFDTGEATQVDERHDLGERPAYELRRLVGIGGQGEVWEAIQRSLDRTIAVKRLPGGMGPTTGASDISVGGFRQEATIST